MNAATDPAPVRPEPDDEDHAETITTVLERERAEHLLHDALLDALARQREHRAA